jgi:hypothetical protein
MLHLNVVRAPGWLDERVPPVLGLFALVAFAVTGFVGVDATASPVGPLAPRMPRALPLYGLFCVGALVVLAAMLRGPHARRRWFVGMLGVTALLMLYGGLILSDATYLNDPVQAVVTLLGRLPPPSPATKQLIYALLSTGFNMLVLLLFAADTAWRWHRRLRERRQLAQSGGVLPVLRTGEVLAGDFLAGGLVGGALSLLFNARLEQFRLFADYCVASVPVPWRSCVVSATSLGGGTHDWPTLTYLDAWISFGCLFGAGLLIFIAMTRGLVALHPSLRSLTAVSGLVLRALFAHAQLDIEIEGFVIGFVNALRLFLVALFAAIAVTALVLAAALEQYYIAVVTQLHTASHGLDSFFAGLAPVGWAGVIVGLLALAVLCLVLSVGVLISSDQRFVAEWLTRLGAAAIYIFGFLWLGAALLGGINYKLRATLPAAFFPPDAVACASLAFFLSVVALQAVWRKPPKRSERTAHAGRTPPALAA